MYQSTKLFLLLLSFTFTSLSAYAQCSLSTVSTTDGENVVYTCPGDGQDDIIAFTNSLGAVQNYAYAITDANFNIIGVVADGNTQNFEGAGPGTCYAWGFSYTGEITASAGESVFSTQFSTGCWTISQNAVRVVRNQPDGGSVATPQGQTEVYVCLNDGIPDFIGFSTNSTSSASYTFVVTDDNNIILGLPNQNFLDFSGAGVGVCRVWGLSFTGNLTAMIGQNAATAMLSDNCFDLSDNFIEVVREEPDGATVSTPEGTNEVYICTEDGTPDIVEFENTSTSSANYAYGITNSDNVLLAIELNDFHDFDGAPTGTCRVWGFSYTGEITAQIGESVFTTQWSSGCYEISSTAISVVRTGVDAGMVMMPSGLTTRYTCPGDGNPDVVSFVTTSTTTANYAYVITDDNNNILGIPPGNSQDFEGAGAGVCRVWGLAYTGNIIAQQGDNAATTTLTDGCFSLSSNFIEIIRESPESGEPTTVAGETTVYTCPGDGNDDAIQFDVTGNSGSNLQLVVTDNELNVLGLPPGNEVNFEGAGVGECWVWSLSFTGALNFGMGDNVGDFLENLSTDCFDLSSTFVTVFRDTPESGEPTAVGGATTVYTCPGDGNDDVLAFEVTGNSASNLQLVVTDNELNVLGLPPGNEVNFEGAGVGECWVWSLSFTGDLNFGMGDNVGNFLENLSSDCFDLSSTFVTVFRDTPESGEPTAVGGATTVYTCPGDGNDDAIQPLR